MPSAAASSAAATPVDDQPLDPRQRGHRLGDVRAPRARRSARSGRRAPAAARRRGRGSRGCGAAGAGGRAGRGRGSCAPGLARRGVARAAEPSSPKAAVHDAVPPRLDGGGRLRWKGRASLVREEPLMRDPCRRELPQHLVLGAARGRLDARLLPHLRHARSTCCSRARRRRRSPPRSTSSLMPPSAKRSRQSSTVRTRCLEFLGQRVVRFTVRRAENNPRPQPYALLCLAGTDDPFQFQPALGRYRQCRAARPHVSQHNPCKSYCQAVRETLH